MCTEEVYPLGVDVQSHPVFGKRYHFPWQRCKPTYWHCWLSWESFANCSAMYSLISSLFATHLPWLLLRQCPRAPRWTFVLSHLPTLLTVLQAVLCMAQQSHRLGRLLLLFYPCGGPSRFLFYYLWLSCEGWWSYSKSDVFPWLPTLTCLATHSQGYGRVSRKCR